MSKEILIWGLNLVYNRFEGKDLNCFEPNFEPKDLLKKIGWTNFLAAKSNLELTNIFTELHCGKDVLGVKDKKINFDFSQNLQELENLKGEESEVYLLNLLEKFGQNLPFFEFETAVSVFDAVKMLAALSESKSNSYRILKGDFSGIQNFVFTSDSENALKIIRARSVFLELLSKSLTLDVCESLEISNACVISSGGGNFQILLPNEKITEGLFKDFYTTVNKFLLQNFEGQIHFVVGSVELRLEDLLGKNFAGKEKELATNLENCKQTKYKSLAKFVFGELKESFGVCKTCGKEIFDKAFEGSDNDNSEDSRCGTCRRFKKFGEEVVHGVKKISGKMHNGNWTYTINGQGIFLPTLLTKNCERHFVVNAKEVSEDFQMILGDYSTREVGSKSLADFEFFGKKSIGSDVLGLLVMDVDNMGLIFLDGMKGLTGVERLVFNQSISRRLDEFFKIKVNEILKTPQRNQTYKPLNGVLKCKDESFEMPKRNATIIFSGGDDLVLTGAWNEVLEIAFEVEEEFRKFIGNNLDIGLSAGFAIFAPKYPFYLAVKEAQKAEKMAKSNLLNEAKLNSLGGKLEGKSWEELLENYESGKSLFVKNENVKSLSLKNNFCFFFDENAKSKVKHSVTWQEAKDKIFTVILTLLEKSTYEEAKNKSVEGKINLGFSRALISKLFFAIDKFRSAKEDDISYQIDLVYNIARERENKDQLNDVLLQNGVWKDENFLLYLPFVLNYLELLIREKGEKNDNSNL